MQKRASAMAGGNQNLENSIRSRAGSPISGRGSRELSPRASGHMSPRVSGRASPKSPKL